MLEFTFYDNEATGVSVRHDQVTQFAGVTCDENFGIKNSISKFIRLLPYVVPHPQALEVTRKTPQEIADTRLETEYEAARQISAFLTPARGTTRVYVTYNGIKYDDEILRTMLYRNLQYPYFNTGRNCIKIDLLMLVQFLHAADPDAIVIPVGEDGKFSYRLERICPANGIDIEAHDAFHDSVATMKLFALVQDRAPWVVELAMQCGNAQAMEAWLAEAASTGMPLFRFTSFGKPDFAPLAFMGSNGQKKHIAIDLRHDDFPRDAASVAERLYSPESAFRVVTSNKFPLLLTIEQMKRVNGDLDLESLLQKALEINAQSDLRASCKDAVSLNTLEKVNDPTSEELIYSGNIEAGDKQRMSSFNAASSWDYRSQIPFSDRRLRDFSARILLEAVTNGDAVLPQEVVRGLAIDCSEALCRPFGAADSRYTTIASCLEYGADDVWIEWAQGRFGDHPVFSAPGTEPALEPVGQMSFGF